MELTKKSIHRVGLGEREDQIEAFDIEKYIYGLFKDL